MNLTNVQLGSSAAPGAPFTMNRYIDAGVFKLTFTGTGVSAIETNGTGIKLIDGRFQIDKGADIVAANDLTAGLDGNVFTVTGNTQINAITSTNWQSGPFIILETTGTPLFKHNTAGGAGTLPMKLAGSVDYQAAADDAIFLYNNGSFWHELGRKQSAGTITANNGLTMSTPTNVQWRGTLNQATTINTAGFNIVFTGANATQSLLTVTNTSAASGAYAIGATAAANVAAISGSNTSTGGGVQGTATSGTGVIGVSTSGLGGGFAVNPSNTNAVAIVIELTRTSSGSAANGIGGRIQFTVENSGGGTRLAVALDAIFTEITDATRVSDFAISTVNSGTTTESVRFIGQGAMKLRNITATAASAITAANGMIVYVSDTDATFTAVGFWGREAGAWVKL